MKRTTRHPAALRPRLAAAWLAAATAAGLVLAAALSGPAAAATACPGGHLTLADNDPVSTTIGADDDLELRLNGVTIFNDNDEQAKEMPPISFTAHYGDQLRVIASNSTIFGGNEFLDSLVLFCDANGLTQVLEPNITAPGNGATGHVFYDKTFTIDFTDADATAPTVTLTTPADGASYLLGQSVAAAYACTDETGGSGLASCTGSVANGAAIDTSTVGSHTFAVVGTDNNGNTATVTHAYSVVYDFRGFFQPIDNSPALNSVKAGASVPVKFSLNGNAGLAIMVAGYPSSQRSSCDLAQVDTLEETATAGASSLSYDPSTDQYVYTWKTEKSWAGTCRRLFVNLVDGTSHRATFLFR